MGENTSSLFIRNAMLLEIVVLCEKPRNVPALYV